MNANERLLMHHFGARPTGWTVRRLGDFFTERAELSSDQTKYPLHSFTIEDGVTEKTDRYERSFLLKDADNNQFKVVYPGDFVVNPMNLRFGAVGMSEKNVPVTVSAYYDVLELKGVEIEANYLLEVLRSERMLNIYDRVAIGSLLEKKRVHLSIFEELRIFLPPVEELKFIASVANGWRRSVAVLDRLVEVKRERKLGLMQRLLSGKTRFNEFQGQKWNTYRLGDLFDERVEIGRTDLPLVSITGQNGVVPRDSLGKRDTSSEDKFKYLRIVPGDIGYNTMRMWQGVSGLSNLGFVSRNDGYLPALEACLSCDRGPFPWLCRCGIRRSVW
jgi:type I restriction enzyme S subunit